MSRSRRAFTLVELCIVLTLCTLVILLVDHFLHSAQLSGQRTARWSAASTCHARLREELGWDLARAVAPDLAGLPAPGTAADRLELGVVRSVTRGAPQVDHVVYARNADTGLFCRNGVALVPEHTDEVHFSRVGDDTLVVALKLAASDSPLTVSFHLAGAPAGPGAWARQ